MDHSVSVSDSGSRAVAGFHLAAGHSLATGLDPRYDFGFVLGFVPAVLGSGDSGLGSALYFDVGCPDGLDPADSGPYSDRGLATYPGLHDRDYPAVYELLLQPLSILLGPGLEGLPSGWEHPTVINPIRKTAEFNRQFT